MAGLARRHQQRMDRARENDGPAGAALLPRPSLAGARSALVLAPAGAVPPAARRSGAGRRRGGFFLRPSSLRMSAALLLLRALRRARRGAAPSTPQQRQNAPRAASAPSTWHLAQAAPGSRTPSAVVAAAAELPLASLVREADQRLLRKDRGVAGVAAERLVRAVREERGAADRAAPGSRRRNAQHRREGGAEQRGDDTRRREREHQPTVGAPHTRPLVPHVPPDGATGTARRPTSTSGTPTAADRMNVAGVQWNAATQLNAEAGGHANDAALASGSRRSSLRLPQLVARRPWPCRARRGGTTGTTSCPRKRAEHRAVRRPSTKRRASSWQWRQFEFG